MKIKKTLPILFCLVVGCTSPTETDTVLAIDIEEAFNNLCDIFLSDFADDVEYIPLENTPESVTGENLYVYATDRYLVAISFKRMQLFDRTTGRFLRKIGVLGQGPNDYLATQPVYGFDEHRQTILCEGSSNNRIVYDLEGNTIYKIFNPEGVDISKNLISLDENSYAIYLVNYYGNDPYKLYLFDDKGNVFKKFANHHSYIPDPNSFFTMPCIFYKWKNNLFFYENCVDTLFHVTKSELNPYYRLKLGKYNPPYSDRPRLPQPNNDPIMDKYFLFRTINETDRFLFFSFTHGKFYQRGGYSPTYFGYHEKQTGITKVSKVDDTHRSPIINDLDDFSPLCPMGWTITPSGEMVAYLEAEDILEWFEANPEKARELPKHLKELSKLKIEDNQVVVIARIKQ